MSADDPNTQSPGAEGAAKVEAQRSTSAPTQREGDDRTLIGDPEAPLTVIGDPSGEVTNRIGGTIQREPRPEDYPPDAKIAPVAEQVAPNQAAQAVGAKPTPEEVAGAPTEPEGNKQPLPGGTDPAETLAPSSDQGPALDRAVAGAAADADTAQAGAVPATDTDGNKTEA